ncbi:MAG: hypothetical protein FWF57_09150 [Defluviitaleaceae bacterium]|nr:hypothetical protein [Defluviitaleaceae bacterium]
MNNKKTKILLTILMFLSLATTIYFVAIYRNINLHILFGIITSTLLTVIFFMQRQWLSHASKSFRSGKIGENNKKIFLINILLFKIWFFAIMSGIISTLVYFNIISFFEDVYTLHGLTAYFGSLLLIIYLGFNIYLKYLTKTKK